MNKQDNKLDLLKLEIELKNIDLGITNQELAILEQKLQTLKFYVGDCKAKRTHVLKYVELLLDNMFNKH